MITKEKYFEDIDKLISKISFKFDCVVVPKRSGLIIGSIFSYYFGKQIYVSSEVSNISNKFKKVLVLDDKCRNGKTIRKIISRLNNKLCFSAVLYKEGYFIPDYYCEDVGNNVELFYDRDGR